MKGTKNVDVKKAATGFVLLGLVPGDPDHREFWGHPAFFMGAGSSD